MFIQNIQFHINYIFLYFSNVYLHVRGDTVIINDFWWMHFLVIALISVDVQWLSVGFNWFLQLFRLFITKKTITAKSRRVSNVFDKQQTICWRDKTGNRNSFPFSPILSLTTGKILTAICAMALHARYIRQTFLLETLGGQQLQCQVGQKCTRWRAEGCFMRGFIRSSGLTLQVSTLCMERDGTKEL